MNYIESRAFIEDAQKYGSVLGLDNMYELMKQLDNPQDGLHIVHVAGTNGKGSVIAYLETVLSEAGYRVGKYISPTLYSYRERMEIGGKPVSREKFAEYLTKAARVIEEMTAQGLPHPTPFEIETAVAFLFFADEKCDLVLLEVGMGGSTDATNIIPAPELAVLASISMDHMSFLGNTLGEIAAVKAGIIKLGCTMVTAKQEPEAEQAVREACQKCRVPYVEAEAARAKTIFEDAEGQTFSWQGEEYQISLGGVHQKENAVLALKALELLDKLGYPTGIEHRKQGLLHTRWNGRFTVIARDPLFIVDGAHNPAAADRLAASIEHYFKGKKLYFIMGMFRDKDFESVIKKTAHLAEKIITVAAPGNQRALTAGELAQAAKKFHKDVEAANSLTEAVEKVYEAASPRDVIISFGSLAFIGDLTRIVEKREEKNNGRFTGKQKTD